MNRNRLSRSLSNHRWRTGIALLLAIGLGLGNAAAARADDGPTLIKPTIIIRVTQLWHTWSPTAKKFLDDNSSWIPDMKFTVVGPVTGGSQFSVEFTKPTGAPWLRMDLETGELKAGDQYTLHTPSSADEKKYTNGIGVFGVKIRLRNELNGTNQLLFSGKFKVSKISKSNGFAKFKDKNDFVVDHDWTLPLAYLSFFPDDRRPLTTAVWFKGPVNGSSLAGYIFYNGKQIGSTKDQGSASSTEEEINTVDNDAKDPTWSKWLFQWFNISDSPVDPANPNPALFYTEKNPGEYVFKVLREGKLVREAKFTVGADGKVVDNGIVAANHLGTSRMALPIKVLGTSDGAWLKTDWVNGAFYGNPLKGFTAP